jgi:hypothetical protein
LSRRSGVLPIIAATKEHQIEQNIGVSTRSLTTVSWNATRSPLRGAQPRRKFAEAPRIVCGRMPALFTEGARRAVDLAFEEARLLERHRVGTEHILLGLLREKESLAARVLGALDITVERFRARVVRIAVPGEEIPSRQVLFTPRAKEVLERALREARSLGHYSITTEDILLGLVREKEGVAARILFELGADPETIRSEVIRVRPPTDRPTERALEERRLALERVKEVRLVRARLKRDIKTGRVDLAEILLEPPPETRNMKVFDLLRMTPGYDRVRTETALTQVRIAPTKTVGGLSNRQRLALAELLGPPPPEASVVQ